jgi:3-deoxy-manno-octulosonate cytidylyltransferase (CMP-KDO synthetase)
MKLIAIIPAHLASVRFPRKILFPLYGLPMIEHVRRRALLSQSLEKVYVATCDSEVFDVVSSHEGDVIMTSNLHKNGSSRVAEAIKNLDCTHVILLQGDEPLLLPRHIDEIAKAIELNSERQFWNVTGPIEDAEELDRHSFVKCTIAQDGRILLCFRRSPFYSAFEEQRKFTRKILGMIAFKKELLIELVSNPETAIEKNEYIEQMRIIENGYSLYSVEVNQSLPSVNEPHEANIVLDYLRNNEEQRKLLDIILQ